MTSAAFAFDASTAFSLHGQTAIITGGARGIGAAVAKGMA
jgi:NADP-dependent 3-hydroxy acid dehydrogenase YdfG